MITETNIVNKDFLSHSLMGEDVDFAGQPYISDEVISLPPSHFRLLLSLAHATERGRSIPVQVLHSRLCASWWVNIVQLISWQAFEKNRPSFHTAGSLPIPSRKPHILLLNALKTISRSSPNVITLLERRHPCNWSPTGHSSHSPLKYVSYSVLNFYVDLIIWNFYLLLSENINPVNLLKHFLLFRVFLDLLRKEEGASQGGIPFPPFPFLESQVQAGLRLASRQSWSQIPNPPASTS